MTRSDCNSRPANYIPQFFSGGIAQLVERQLCKLEVRGSNPLASSVRLRRRSERRLSRRSLWRRRTSFDLAQFLARATTRQARYEAILLCLYSPTRSGPSEVLLRRRLRNHNSGRIVHTSKWKPWQLKTYIALSDRERAFRLERYLKSASGRAFVKRHF